MGPGMQRILTAAVLSVWVLNVSATQHALNNGVRSMLEQGVSISRERRNLETQQADLLKQKVDLDAVGKALDQQQALLNQDIESNNQAIARHNGKTDQNQSSCQRDNGSVDQTNDCNKDIKTLNVSRAELKAQQDALKQRQDELNATYQRHSQDVQTWNDKEQKTVSRLNAVYQGQNNWMDAANSLIASDAFQALMTEANASSRCGNTVPKVDRITPALLQKYAETIVGCLSYVAKHAADARAD